MINRVIGTRFKMVQGYRGAGDILLAIDRGEVQRVCMSLGQFRTSEQKFKEGKLRYLLRAEESPLPGVPDVPSIYDFAKTDEQKQLMRFIFSSTEFGRPYLFPPGVPEDRVDFMRKAIERAVKNPELLAEAGKMKLDMVYRPPEHLEQVVQESLRHAAGADREGQADQPQFEIVIPALAAAFGAAGSSRRRRR